MKKKGLIIATIVMVLVLAVSLTTATYAWFTVSDVTTIEAFSVSVVPNNAVNIGLLKTYKAYDPDAKPTNDSFVSGAVTYTPGTAGELGGSWAGDPGLGATIDHNISWGSQKKAVGATTGTVGEGGTATVGNTTLWAGSGTLIAANGVAQTSLDAVSAKAAVANINEENTANAKAADYVHMVLGVQATKDLQTNELVLLLDGTNSKGTIVGILAAVHVAYRINDDEWEDAQFFSCTYDKLLADQTLNMGDRGTSYENSYKHINADITAPTSKAGMVVIDLSDVAKNNSQIAQVEILIYIAGSDTDCNNAALNASGDLSIFFHTVAATQG